MYAIISFQYSEIFAEYECHDGFENRVRRFQWAPEFLTAETDVF